MKGQDIIDGITKFIKPNVQYTGVMLLNNNRIEVDAERKYKARK